MLFVVITITTEYGAAFALMIKGTDGKLKSEISTTVFNNIAREGLSTGGFSFNNLDLDAQGAVVIDNLSIPKGTLTLRDLFMLSESELEHIHVRDWEV